jgi:8-oxo-dGTP pyrophosphatase MutT (NUDIX family)
VSRFGLPIKWRSLPNYDAFLRCRNGIGVFRIIPLPSDVAGSGRLRPLQVDPIRPFQIARTDPMSLEPWKPNVTVAAVVERDGRFLFVEERTRDGLRLNQPAGHLEPGESLLQAVVRETLEEAAVDFTPTALVGVYLLHPAEGSAGVTYLRFAFAGTVGEPHPGRRLDRGIVRSLWLTAAELAAHPVQLRSTLVAQALVDYQAGHRHPLTLLSHTAAGAMRARPQPPAVHGTGHG